MHLGESCKACLCFTSRWLAGLDSDLIGSRLVKRFSPSCLRFQYQYHILRRSIAAWKLNYVGQISRQWPRPVLQTMLRRGALCLIYLYEPIDSRSDAARGHLRTYFRRFVPVPLLMTPEILAITSWKNSRRISSPTRRLSKCCE